jgi:hypothetical protein
MRPERTACRHQRPVLAPTATGWLAACHFAGELTSGGGPAVTAHPVSSPQRQEPR